MLNIFYGDMKEAVYNTASYFKYDYEEGWIVDPMVKKMIQDVDKSVVIDSGIIDSPVLGKIPPIGLSGGVKTLILVKFEPEKVFNVSTCGDNCAKWLLKIAEQEDRTVNLRHLMDFGKKPFTIKVLNASAITFFAVGYGDLFPATLATKMVSLVEAFSGVTMTSYFLVLLSRKVIR